MAEVVRRYEAAVEAGSVPSCVNLGALWFDGWPGQPPNPGRAESLWRQAYEAGDPHAADNLGGLLLADGRSEEGIAVVQEAVRRGSDEARVRLGWAHIEGLGVDADPLRGFAMIRAIAGRNLWALGSLGQCYRDGLGTDPSPERARQAFEQAAEQGDPRAMVELAGLDRGVEAVAASPTAREWLERAAAVEHPEAMAHLGALLIRDRDSSDAWRRGLDLLRAASRRGEPWAAYVLAREHLEGRTVERDLDCAYRLAAMAAEHLPEGRLLLGWMVQNGKGTRRDFVAGHGLIQAAAEVGHERAVDWLAQRGRWYWLRLRWARLWGRRRSAQGKA